MKTYIALMAVLVLAAGADAAGYLKIDGVDGECNFTWGISTLAASTGRATGRRQHKPFVVSKPVDKASPLLMSSLILDEPIPLVEFFVCANPVLDADGNCADCEKTAYFKVTMRDVLVTSFETSGSGDASCGLPSPRCGSSCPGLDAVEQYVLTFNDFEWTYLFTDGSSQTFPPEQKEPPPRDRGI
mmetsp:Transcript_3196/g.8812  ORF Transcript_3196/g.8812 Transcript_3196/m.8812 type:complete len:186 (-) Transcript_3196:483-1040(-)